MAFHNATEPPLDYSVLLLPHYYIALISIPIAIRGYYYVLHLLRDGAQRVELALLGFPRPVIHQ